MWLPGGRVGWGIVREFGVDMYSLLYLKWITNKDLLYSTWNTALCYVAAWMRVSLGENRYMCMYGWVPSLFTWNYYNIVNWLYPNTKSEGFFLKKKEIMTLNNVRKILEDFLIEQNYASLVSIPNSFFTKIQ